MNEPLNPYAPPEAVSRTRSLPFPSALLCVFAVIQALSVAGLWVVASGLIVDASAILTISALVLAVLVAGGFVALVWLKNQWKRLPARLQVVKAEPVTPGQAAWRLVIPLYNLYWMFVVNAALCDSINALLAKKARPMTAPIWLATICPLTIVVGNPATRFLPMFAEIACAGVFAAL